MPGNSNLRTNETNKTKRTPLVVPTSLSDEVNDTMEPQNIVILLRPGWRIEIELPGDLTAKEAEDIAASVRQCVRSPDDPQRN